MLADADHPVYSPLSDPRSIRILVLKPALLFNAPIRCSFLSITLPHGEQIRSEEEFQDPRQIYEALSYTWGALEGTKPVTCDGHTLPVTPNCDQALRHLRLKFQPRNLWVDALCINQQSLTEKNHQVPIMGDIYRGAIRTILWLGPVEDEDLVKVLRNARRFGHLRRAYRRIRPDSPAYNWHDESKSNMLNQNERGRIARLCANQWFHRMWTIQEFLLSRSSLFRMGDVECPSIDLYKHYNHGGNIIGRADLEHFRMRNALLSFSPSKLAVESNVKELFTIFLYHIIKLGACNKSTDARDKIYAIYAYLKSHYPDFDLPEVDYSKPIGQLYELFTRSIISQTDNLWVLEIANPQTLPIEEGGSDSQESEVQLPSWVLDLRHSQRIGSLWTSTEHPWHRYVWDRGTFNPATIVTSSIRGQLPIRARRIGTVTDLSSRMPFWDLISPNHTPKQRVEEIDAARTACLDSWAAFCTDLDEKYPTGQEWSYLSALGHNTEELSYLGERNDTLDSETGSISSFENSLPWRLIRKQVEKMAEERHENGRDSFGDPDAHDMCALFSYAHHEHEDEEGAPLGLGESQGDVSVGDGIYCVDGCGWPVILRRAGATRGEGERSWNEDEQVGKMGTKKNSGGRQPYFIFVGKVFIYYMGALEPSRNQATKEKNEGDDIGNGDGQSRQATVNWLDAVLV